jgi:hypothetical protein
MVIVERARKGETARVARQGVTVDTGNAGQKRGDFSPPLPQTTKRFDTELIFLYQTSVLLWLYMKDQVKSVGG